MVYNNHIQDFNGLPIREDNKPGRMESILQKYDYHNRGARSQDESLRQVKIVVRELLTQRINLLPEFPRMVFKRRMEIMVSNHDVQKLSREWFTYLEACVREKVCAYCGFSIEDCQPINTYFCSDEHSREWSDLLNTLDEVYQGK